MTSHSNKKTIVVVGGGYGGFSICKLLDQNFNVILIERRQTFYHNVGSPRLLIQPDFHKKLYIPYDKLMKNGRVINKVAREIGIDRVILEDGEEVAFDYLVIATGSNNPAPFKTLINVNEAPTYINSISEQVAQAKKILIVGGGAVGVEVAGEIVYKYTDKEVTIVNSTDKLISNVFKEKFHQLLEKKLKTHRVEVVTDKIAFPDDIKELLKTQSAIPYQCERKTYTTESGKQIEADLVFWTVGNKLNNEPLQTHFAGVLNDQGRIKVNNSLQVEGYQNIFAIGDINSISELKTSYHATSHAETAASNINAIESAKDKNNVKLKEHKSQSPMMVASFGPKDGVGQVYGLVISGFVVSLIKSKELFVDRFTKALNNPKPYTFS